MQSTPSPTPSPSQTGQQKYKIGQGSFGRVYRYRYEDEEYAVKKVYKDSKNHPELVEKIEAEGRIMGTVAGHRNVVGYLGEMMQGKFLYLLTELVPHGDLRKIVGTPCEEDIWEIVMQMAMALSHLQKKGIIHRDIKPENILIKSISRPGEEPEIVLKLADFGLAEVVVQGQTVEGIAGSPIYLAPQMCNYEPYSFEVDIWSLGITLYQLAHNQKSPYNDNIALYIATHPAHTEKQLFSFLTSLIQSKKIVCTSPYPEINTLIESMLVRDPKLRPTPGDLLRCPRVVERLERFNGSKKNNMKMGKTLSISTRGQLSGEGGKENTGDNGLNQHATIKKESKIDSNHELVYSKSPSDNELELFLSSRISRSLISQLEANPSSEPCP